VASVLRVTTRNARFQQWQALLGNRNKRQRSGEFLVQGVRPITLAVQHGWQVRALLYDADRSLSQWAAEILEQVAATRVAVAPELLAELGEKTEAPPELIAVVALPPDDLGRIPVHSQMTVVVFDRPTSPGNIGTLIRSADALGAAGVITTGHAADVYDPKAVRASTGSLFAIPTIRASGSQPVLDWVTDLRSRGLELRIVGTDEAGEAEVHDQDLTGPTLLLVGNETAGLSAAWRQAADHLVRIPMVTAPGRPSGASSLNAATAASIVLYEAVRQRRTGQNRIM
jgi:tRNA G18 (ribose-2'-O)-methylase SpoU